MKTELQNSIVRLNFLKQKKKKYIYIYIYIYED